MPGNGYPMRLLLPGYEGNMNVKFLRRIKLIDQPAMTYYEARTYSQILPDGKAYRFYFLQEVKSFITSPSLGMQLKEPGYLRNFRHRLFRHRADRQGAWFRPMAARAGREAALQGPVQPKAFTRFRMPWRWDGGPAILQSRAWDEAGNMQPTREQFVAARGETTKAAVGARLSQPALQRHHQLGRRRQGGGQACLCVSPSRFALVRVDLSPAASRCRATAPSSASRSARPTSRPGTSTSCRTAPICRLAAARRRRAQGIRREMRAVPRRERQGRHRRRLVGGPPPRRASTAARPSPISGLTPPRCSTTSAAPCRTRAALAQQRGGLRAHRLPPRRQQADRRERRDRTPRRLPQGEDAEPGQLHHPLPGPDLSVTLRDINQYGGLAGHPLVKARPCPALIGIAGVNARR